MCHSRPLRVLIYEGYEFGIKGLVMQYFVFESVHSGQITLLAATVDLQVIKKLDGLLPSLLRLNDAICLNVLSSLLEWSDETSYNFMFCRFGVYEKLYSLTELRKILSCIIVRTRQILSEMIRHLESHRWFIRPKFFSRHLA